MTIELTFIPALLIILFAAGLGRLLSKGVRQPMILGEVILGIVLGSFIGFADPETVVNIVDPEPILAIASIGILLLLFSTGLGINFEEFKRLEVSSSIVAGSGVILPFILGYLTTIFFFHDHLIALFVGVALVATSVGVGASILTELRMLRTRIGTLIMGAAVMDDIIGVLMMSLVGIAVVGAVTVTDVVLLVIFTVLFFLLSLTAGIKLFRKFSEKVHPGGEDLLMLGLIV
ncbi:MAG: cation:proton antiporter, partial [Candidatus Hadarchaeota archaeon]|nr:cation:proton antiporter [Candidatus Hadarchaeota archaeon]